MAQSTTNRMNSLISNDYIVKTFSELPTPFQMAIIWYMAVEGDAWDQVDLPNINEDNFGSCFNDFLPDFVKNYGDSETIHDGWHRFHSYIRKNIATIPAVFFM